MRLVRRLLPFSTASGAAWFAFRHRELLWDWGTWTAQALPRAVGGHRRRRDEGGLAPGPPEW